MDKNSLVKTILGEQAEIISPLFGGMMNESYIVANKGKRYVLYISTKQANEMVDRRIERDNQAIVYGLGVTSKNVYFDIEKGIKMNEYIEGSSLDKVDVYDVDKVAELFHKVHASKKLSEIDYNPFERLSGFISEAKQYLGNDETYNLAIKTLNENKDFMLNCTKVLCHNDAQRSNIVKGDDGNYSIIDFEFMANNDPIYDIATFGNGKVSEGRELLNAYFKAPNKEEILKYYLWRTFISIQWYIVAIIKHYRGEGATHNINFLAVADHFIANAKEALQGYMENR